MSAFCSPFVNKHYLKLVRKHNGKPPAEVRLIPMMWSCWFISIGLSIFGWTSHPRLDWAGPALGGWSVGFGLIYLYNSANNYLVDSYQHQAASALAAKTLVRSLWSTQSSCSRSRCTILWITNGRAHCWRSLPRLAARSHTSSTIRALLCGNGLAMPMLVTRKAIRKARRE